MFDYKGFGIWGLSAAALLAGIGCGGADRAGVGEAVSQRSAALSVEQRVSIPMPGGTDFRATALGGSGTLQIADRAQIKSGANFAAVTNAGNTLSDFGVSSQLGGITSVAAVGLHDRARVNGSVVSSGAVTQSNGVVVTGTISPNTTLGSPDVASWRVQFQQSTQDIILQPAKAASLAPGAYSHVTVYSSAQVALRSGTYFIDQLDLEPQSTVKLDESAGPIFLYVKTSLIYRGKVIGGTADKLLLGYLSTTATALESSFNGTLIAPSASVRFGVGGTPHSGAAFAKNLQIDPDVQFNFAPFSGWDSVPFDVTPTLNCVERRSDSTFAALLGYFNPNSKPITVSLGTSNSFGSPQDRGQPTTFLSGHFPAEFSVDFNQASSLTWQLDGSSLAIPRSAIACPTTFPVSFVQDTTVALSTPQANFGSSNSLTLADSSEALVQFDRDQIKKTLGTGRYVTKAVLTLTQVSGGQPAVDALVMTRRWTELGATWDCVNDTNASASAETCAPGDSWKLDRDDLTQKNPWRVHGPARQVVGTFAGGKLQFDVTRDVWNLLGSDGVLHPPAWALVEETGASGSAVLASRESTTPPVLVLTVTTRPQSVVPLSLSVDTTLKPAQPTVVPLVDGAVRTVSALISPQGTQADFVDGELLYDIQSDVELAPVLARWGGSIVREIHPPARSPFYPTTAVVRIDASRAQPATLLPRLLEIDNRPFGAHKFSSTTGLATVAAAAEELSSGRRVSLNWLSRSASPSSSDWASRSVADGPWNPVVGPSAHPLSQNPFFWPGFASCDPDPASPDFPPPCRTKLADGSGIFQQLTVAEAWRALALSGRLLPGSVLVALVDSGFAASHPDYPPFSIGPHASDIGFQPAADEFAHGTKVMLTGYAQAGNALGAAGPGGPVATVDIEADPVTRDGITAGLEEGSDVGSRVISTSVVSTIPAIATIFTSMSELTREIRDDGSLVFAAAGNDGLDVDAETCFVACWESAHYSPCEDDGVDCVTGMAFNDTVKDPQSNWGSDTATIAGPFETTVSNIPLDLVNGVLQPRSNADGSFDNSFSVGFAGTSAATPFIAGLASLLVAADPAQTTDRQEHCLFEPIRPSTDGSFRTRFPDALASVRCVETGSSFGDLPTFLHIDLPTDGANVDIGQLVNVEATATDYEVGLLPVNWSSDVDGPLLFNAASGSVGTVQFHTPGVQHLTATAVGSDGIPASQTITVNVASSATTGLFIGRPVSDGLHFAEGFEVTLQASLVAVDELICSLVKWSSTGSNGTPDFDGLTGCTVQPTILGAGSHHIVASYVAPDSSVPLVASREIEIDAIQGFLVQIVSPPNTGDSQAEFGQVLTLVAQQLNGANVSYEWTVTMNGVTVSVPGSESTVTFSPDSFFTETCANLTAQIDLVATNGVDGTHAGDSEQFLLGPSETFKTDNCAK